MKSRSIKKSLSFISRCMVLLLILLLVPFNFEFHYKISHDQQKESSDQLFDHVKQIIAINERDLKQEKEEFSQVCIQKADMVAYFIQHEPDMLYDLDRLRELARILDVDEIHFFNKEGEIFSGTHPEYYGYSVEDGEQIGFFRQMLEDTSLKICQDIMPNTAEGKEMQYAAVWLEDKSSFVEIGMKPERLLALMEENSLQSVVGSIPFDYEGCLYIINAETMMTEASSESDMVGKEFPADLLSAIKNHSQTTVNTLHFDINSERSCVYTELYDDYLLVRTYSSKYLIQETLVSTVMVLGYILLTTLCVIWVIIRYVRQHILQNLITLNEELKKIEQGNLEALHMTTHISEFDTLTYYINQLLKSVRFNSGRISEIIDSGQLPLGVFEYNQFYKKTFLNQWMKKFLGMDGGQPMSFETEKNLALEKLSQIEQNCVDPEQKVYWYERDGAVNYVKMQKSSDEQSTIYYLTDVSSWWQEINMAKNESGTDILTGLYNRRGLEEQAKHLFNNPQILKKAAVIMVDADGLKRINDLYGHPIGDEYLKTIASFLSIIPRTHCISARLGGDEFAAILYGFDSHEQMSRIIEELGEKRGTRFLPSSLGADESVEFSMGYTYCTTEERDYQRLMGLADERMYQEKRKRKAAADEPDSIAPGS